jgi:hypothetical protein
VDLVVAVGLIQALLAGLVIPQAHHHHKETMVEMGFVVIPMLILVVEAAGHLP